jgi:hypothetical protein
MRQRICSGGCGSGLEIDQTYDSVANIGTEGSMLASNAAIRAARLNALTVREGVLTIQNLTEVIHVWGERFDKTADDSIRTITNAITQYEKATTAAAASMEWWTKAQTITAIVLAGFTLAQVVIAVLEYLN